MIRDESTKREGGGAPEVFPLRKGGTEKVLPCLRGQKNVCVSFYTVA